MVLIDPESSPSDPLSSAAAARAASTGEKSSVKPLGHLLALALAAALIAGVVSSLAGELILNAYHTDLFPALSINPNPEDMRRWRDARIYSATLTFTTMGALLGLTMGLAGGLARRSVFASAERRFWDSCSAQPPPRAWLSSSCRSFFKRYDPQAGDLLLPLLTHGAIWSAVGAIGGLAFGLGLGGRGRWKASLVGGLVGAAAATVVYEIVGAIAFASSKTDLPLSSSITTRVVALMLVAILSAVGAVLALNQSAKKKAASSVLS